jgi:hypothetical protein
MELALTGVCSVGVKVAFRVVTAKIEVRYFGIRVDLWSAFGMRKDRNGSPSVRATAVTRNCKVPGRGIDRTANGEKNAVEGCDWCLSAVLILNEGRIAVKI